MTSLRFALTEARFATGDRERLLSIWVDHWIEDIFMRLVFFSHWAPGEGSVRRSRCLHHETKPPHNCPTCPLIEEEDRVRIMRGHLGRLGAFRTGGGIKQGTTTH